MGEAGPGILRLDPTEVAEGREPAYHIVTHKRQPASRIKHQGQHYYPEFPQTAALRAQPTVRTSPIPR